ncbi:MAG: cytochrome P450 [Pseudomonadota bacterium]
MARSRSDGRDFAARYHLGQQPESFAALKADPSLVLNAAHEAIRIGTPIRSFTRKAARAVEIEGVAIPKGARVMMLYASANRDERVFAKPDTFDLTRRNARMHIGFGAGIHMCVGMHLALLEIECLALALTRQVDQIEIATAKPALNNSICAYASVAATVTR